MRQRAVALIYNDSGEVLLILRRKNGKAYATLPGGGIEAGETPAEACAREVLEEVNLTVEVGEQLLELDNLNNHEHYFRCAVTGGEMQLGNGPESLRQSENNFYDPQWVALNRLEEVNLVPEVLRGLAREHRPGVPAPTPRTSDKSDEVNP
ncbi:NUDIX hydrolase [Deinococcus sp. Marseille-Q6407]|uniref:NUDIX hydrolase n=1 Tax=Deinococcus sp. Marseille-Q6407 TaxID=2969223 RepID=UPI0021C0B604|nr:NUDIX domain-containing protein [Deinococcus sp. Marseille-Q6407]